MKKLIALILTLALCLSLCACGVDEKYVSLLEQLEAANYEGIKSELSTLSPDFKAEQAQMAADAELLAKYANLIAALEAEDYNSALADVTGRMPVPEEPSYTTVEITAENWQEYLELIYEEKWHINGFNEGENLTPQYVLRIKDTYADRITNFSEVKIDVEFTFEWKHYDCEYDLVAMTYTKGGLRTNISSGNDGTQTQTLYADQLLDHKNPLPLASGSLITEWNVIYYPENFEILRIQGTLSIIDE